MVYCSACGTQISPQALTCPNCGHPNAVNPAAANAANGFNKSRTTAGILAILLGGFGVHKFYLGKIGMGILYFVFAWTGVPSIIGIIEGIIYLTQTDQAFAQAQTSTNL
jgi:TM2 domain-containing membrane protein YozV